MREAILAQVFRAWPPCIFRPAFRDSDAGGDKGRVLGRRVGGGRVLEKEFGVIVTRDFLLLQPGLHWHPRAMQRFPAVVHFIALGLDAALSFLVLGLASSWSVSSSLSSPRLSSALWPSSSCLS